jgi:hypothetical protein
MGRTSTMMSGSGCCDGRVTTSDVKLVTKLYLSASSWGRFDESALGRDMYKKTLCK